MKYLEKFRVKSGSKVNLGEIDPGFTDKNDTRENAKAELQALAKRLRKLQGLLYAEHKQSLLICLQAMDAGGKDGTIKHVLGNVNPQGCKVVSFKEPSLVERDHDYLWRIHAHTPAKGEIAIFNRSHYEDLLVARVHDLVPKTVWTKRYDQINAFEDTLVRGQTHVLKFFLHIDKNTQLDRFKKRLDDPAKHWKISTSDYSERKLWDDYTKAYEQALSKCSTAHAPWFIIPANHKWFRNLAVSRIVVEHLEGLNMEYPPPSVDLEQIRQEYHQAESDG